MTYVTLVEDGQGDLADIIVYCGYFCSDDNAREWPGGMETDYDVYCDRCNVLVKS